jgi:putative aldouronate transport system substrate-binding protein
MCIATFVGCANQADKEMETTTTKTQSSSSAEPSKESGPSWKIDTSPVTLTVFFGNAEWYSRTWDPENSLLDKYILEETGVTLEHSSGSEEKFNAMIASGTLPDLVVMDNSAPQFRQLQDNGKLQALNKLALQYAPNFKLPEVMANWYKADDGNNYYFINYMYDPNKEIDKPYTQNYTSVRKDIADKFGIKNEDFSTKRGFIDALKKVKGDKYNGKDVVPFYVPMVGDGKITWFVERFAQNLGVRYEDKSGNYADWSFSGEAVEALKFFNELMREGLMLKDNLLETREKYAQRGSNGELFSIFASSASAELDINVLASSDEKAWFYNAPLTTGDAGKKPFLLSPGSIGWTGIGITTSCKKPERAIRFYEFMSTDEMQMNSTWGMKDAAWTYDSNNKNIKFTESFNSDTKENPDSANKKYGTYSLDHWIQNWPNNLGELPDLSRPWLAEGFKSREMYADNILNSLPFYGINPRQGTDLAGKFQKLTDEYDKVLPRIVMNAKSEAEVDTMMDELKKYFESNGYSEVLKYINDQFQANKKKLGVKFAYPENELN